MIGLFIFCFNLIVIQRRWTEEKARLANKRADNQAKRVKEIAEKEARRTAVLSEWERTCSQPQSTEVSLLSILYSCMMSGLKLVNQTLVALYIGHSTKTLSPSSMINNVIPL